MAGSGRKVRDLEEAVALLEAWESTGERMLDWCQERGINWYWLSAFRGWMRSWNTEATAGASSTAVRQWRNVAARFDIPRAECEGIARAFRAAE